MSLVRVTPEQLQTVSTQLSSGSTQVESILSQLAAQTAPLGSDWAGVAQARFTELWSEWQRNAAGLHEALTGIAQLMAQASSSYAETEAANAARFGA